MSLEDSALKKLISIEESLQYISKDYPELDWKFQGVLQELKWLMITFRKYYIQSPN